MKHLIYIFLIASLPLLSYAQPSIQWQKCLGGSKQDIPGSIIPTNEGGYIMTGSTQSTDGDVHQNQGGYDLWVVKMSPDGSIKWQKTYGGTHDDFGGSIMQTSDGGYLIGAETYSDDGDLQTVGHHGTTSTSDIWILKIDSIGVIQWQKTFGGSGNDYFVGLEIAGEGEYLVCANTDSSDGDVKGFHGGASDIWVFDFVETGTIRWQKTFGGTKDDNANSLIKTSDGNYIIAGYTNSTDGDVQGRIRDSTYDVWLLKVNPLGSITWQKTYGGSGFDLANDAIETLDHGYIFSGYTTSDDGDVSGLHGAPYTDAWVVKLDSVGRIKWQKCYGGSNGDVAFTIFQNPDSSYLIGAYTSSDDGDVTGLHGNTGATDCWIFKISKTGKLLWQRTLGGNGVDGTQGTGIMPARDSGFLLLTETQSIDGDVSGRKGSTSDWDIWLVKLFPETAAVNSSPSANENIFLYPNPSIGKTKIYYTLDKPSEVKIELYNPLGENLRTFINEKEEAGNHEHEFWLSGFPSGSYFLKIAINGNAETRLIEVVK